MHETQEPLPVTVVVPTIGRPQLLRSCLESLVGCRPRAAELLVVDQSDGSEVAGLVEEFGAMGARTVRSTGGAAVARNVGLRSAKHDIVLSTDDDCTVARDWVQRGWGHMQTHAHAIVTGRVLAAGDGSRVPSTNVRETPTTYDADTNFSVLYTGNMVGNRVQLLALGGFDERMRVSAGDNEFCYRWLQAGRPLRFEPDMVVWHHDWRTCDELKDLYVRYAIGQGMFYAKCLWRGDGRVLRYVLRDVLTGVRGVAARFRHGEPASPDWRLGILRGLPRGLILGFRDFRPGRESR